MIALLAILVGATLFILVNSFFVTKRRQGWFAELIYRVFGDIDFSTQILNATFFRIVLGALLLNLLVTGFLCWVDPTAFTNAKQHLTDFKEYYIPIWSLVLIAGSIGMRNFRQQVAANRTYLFKLRDMMQKAQDAIFVAIKDADDLTKVSTPSTRRRKLEERHKSLVGFYDKVTADSMSVTAHQFSTALMDAFSAIQDLIKANVANERDDAPAAACISILTSVNDDIDRLVDHVVNIQNDLAEADDPILRD